MQRFTRFRQVLVMAGVASLMLATSVSAGASSTSGKYNAADAKLVPASYKGRPCRSRRTLPTRRTNI